MGQIDIINRSVSAAKSSIHLKLSWVSRWFGKRMVLLDFNNVQKESVALYLWLHASYTMTFGRDFVSSFNQTFSPKTALCKQFGTAECPAAGCPVTQWKPNGDINTIDSAGSIDLNIATDTKKISLMINSFLPDARV